MFTDLIRIETDLIMKKYFQTLCLLCTLAMLVSGCAGQTASPTRYLLPDADNREAPAGYHSQLKLRAPRLAGLLDGEGIVMQVSALEFQTARQHLWAEPLEHQLERHLERSLESRLGGVDVVRSSQATPSLATLSISIDRFHGRYDGLSVVAGQWRLDDAKGQPLATDAFQVLTPLQADGYPALIRALGQGFERASGQMADAIVMHLMPPDSNPLPSPLLTPDKETP